MPAPASQHSATSGAGWRAISSGSMSMRITPRPAGMPQCRYCCSMRLPMPMTRSQVRQSS